MMNSRVLALIAVSLFYSFGTFVANAEYQLNKHQKAAFKTVAKVLDRLEKKELLIFNQNEADPDPMGEEALRLFKLANFKELDEYFDEIVAAKAHSHEGRYIYVEVAEYFRDQFAHTAQFQAWRDTTGSSHAYALSGLHEMNLAWRKRGSDVASKVTQKGWVGFAEHLEISEGYLKKCREIDPKHPGIYDTWMTVEMGKGDDLDAFEKLYLEGIKHHPENGIYYNKVLYALTLKWGGTIERRLAFAKKYGARQKADALIVWSLHQILKSALDDWSHESPTWPFKLKEVSTVYERLLDFWIKMVPNAPRPYSSSAMILMRHNAFDYAKKYSTMGVEKFPEDWRVQKFAGESRFYLKDYKNAIPYLEKCFELVPEYAIVHYQCALSYQEIGKPEKALSLFKKSLDKLHLRSERRKRVDSYYFVTRLALELKKADEAAAYAKAGIAEGLEKEMPGLHLVLGDVAQWKEDKAAARKHYLKAVELDPRFKANLDKAYPGWEKW